MAEPGDPNTPDDPPSPPSRIEDGARSSSPRPTWATPVRDTAPSDPDHDDLIGFTSPASLTGIKRQAQVEAGSNAPDVSGESEADLFDPRPAPIVRPTFVRTQAQTQSQGQTPRDDGLSLRAFDPPSSSRTAEAPAAASIAPEPTPAWAIETPREARPPGRPDSFGRVRATAEGRRVPPNAPPEGAMGLYTIYALILFAVPTLGVAAVVALIAIHGRPRPKDALAQSHYVFQQRTVWIAAVAAILGVLMIAVNLGVFVLFFVALWVLARGAAGLLRLSGGRAIENRRTWLL